MHFSLRKTFSLLNTHRRVRSDAPEELQSNPPPRLQSWSLTRIEELIFGSSTQVAPKPFYISVASPSLYQLPTPSQRLVFPKNISKTDAELPTLENRIASLQTENDQLKEKIATLELDARICDEELAKFRSDYYAERFKANIRRRLVSVSEAKSQAQNDQLEQAEAFILSMIEVGLHQPVLSEAWQAVKVGCPSDEALVHAIKKAAAVPGTSWSSIIPAVTSSRTHDQTLHSIPLTLKARKDLNATVKAAMFWKSPVKVDLSPDKTATPSASDISPTEDDTADHRNEMVVDNLLSKLREGEVLIRSPVNSKRGPQESVLTPDCVDYTSGRARIVTTDEPTSSLDNISHSIALPDPPSLDRVQECIPTPLSHAADLAPLASQTFKDERAACHHSPRRLRLSLSNQKRPAFGKIDINRSVQKLNSFRKVIDKPCAKPSAKALGKRKAIMVKEDMQLIAAAYPSLDSGVHLAITQTYAPHSALQHSSNASKTLHTVLDTGTIPNPFDIAPAASAQTAQPLCDQGTLLPEKALLSLERICAGFSSGSLGSLAMVSEDSKVNHLGAGACDSLPNLRSTVSPIKHKPMDSISRAPPIFRKSVLPVLKVRRVVSVSSKRPMAMHTQPTAQGVSNVVNTNTTSSKKLTRTSTSPLRITKRARPSVSDIAPRKPRTLGPVSTGSIARGFSAGRFGSKHVKPVVDGSPIAF